MARAGRARPHLVRGASGGVGLRRRWAAGVLTLNSIWFAGLHVAWATGWRWGIPAEMPSVTDRPLFLAYDLAAAAGMVMLALVGVVLVRRPMRGSRPLRIIMWTTAVVCGARAAIGILGDISAARQNMPLTPVTIMADVWFLTTAALAALVLLAERKPNLRET